ncbi:rhox homeobox family member 1-like [Sciurus carolinensis]|uniref:rhox homeobox family member 1-like n=1 Tax=Sciurus carolinensis TaxID=30640 RepID=UPI001FB36CBD|nr:rhox homeobox family member 1-like [Sciurus carolinensis]
MDGEDQYCGSNYYGLGMYEVDMNVEEQGVAVEAAKAGSGHFGENVGLFDNKKLESDMIQEGDVGLVGHGSSLEPRRQPQPMEREELAAVVPLPRRRRPRIQYKFSKWQLQELESLFQESQYPDVLSRRELARRVYVAETKVQAWFKYRRAKHRKYMRETLLRNAPTSTQHDDDAMMEGP